MIVILKKIRLLNFNR